MDIKNKSRQATHRNSAEPYILPLGNNNCLLTGRALQKHIDSHTLSFKHWYVESIKCVSSGEGQIKLATSNGNITYFLTIAVDNSELLISCDCDRKVDKLCNHAYHTLDYIINFNGAQYFQKYRC